jgi:hypothetical protein
MTKATNKTDQPFTIHCCDTGVPTMFKKTEQLHQRIGKLSKEQIIAWQQMSAAERLAIAFQAYQFALEAVRLTERQRHPDLSTELFNWRVVRRMQGNQKLGRDICS